MCPLGTKTIWNIPWHVTLLTLIQVIFYFHLFFQPLVFNTILVTYIIKLHFFPILLICSIYTTRLYFTMARRKLPPIFTPNMLESMIEYTLISSILDEICEMTSKPCKCPRDDTWLLPLQHLLEIGTWGTKWKTTIDKTYEWATWWWVNEKKKESFAILKQIVNIPKEDMEDYHWVMFTHAMDFF